MTNIYPQITCANNNIHAFNDTAVLSQAQISVTTITALNFIT